MSIRERKRERKRERERERERPYCVYILTLGPKGQHKITFYLTFTLEIIRECCKYCNFKKLRFIEFLIDIQCWNHKREQGEIKRGKYLFFGAKAKKPKRTKGHWWAIHKWRKFGLKLKPPCRVGWPCQADHCLFEVRTISAPF